MPHPKQAPNTYVEQLDDEVCVYDWELKQMHSLNPTAALVWEQCDGQTNPTQMAARLQSELNVPNADKLVALSLNRLEKAHLLDGATPQTQRTITRREVLKMAGIGIALLPVISSIALPSAVEAQSVFCYDDIDDFFQTCGNDVLSLGDNGTIPNSCEECYQQAREFADQNGCTLVAVYFNDAGNNKIGCGACLENCRVPS